MLNTHLFQAPQLTGEVNRTSEAFGAAVWLWMHLPSQRQLSIKHLQNRLLEPIHQGQYVLVSARTPAGDRDPVALLLYACLSAKAESRYIAEPAAPMLPADWRSGDRLWLIDWVSPFGRSLCLREAMLGLFARQTARSLSRHGGVLGRSVLTWRGATCTPHGAQKWWQDRPIQSADANEPTWPDLSSWGVTVPAELFPRERPDFACH